MLQMSVVTNEMNMLCPTVTQPALGVIATSPTTAPMAAPIADGRRPSTQSRNTHVAMAVAAAVLVLRNAEIATPSAASDDPPLKPNQPSHNNAAPSSTNGIFAALPSSLLRFPRKMAPARAATPDAACTTIPPAKSCTCICAKIPSGCHVQCASGQYTNITHSIIKIR